MKMRFKRVILLMSLVCSVGMSSTANAGLQDALDGMFMSNSTTPDSFTNQSRGGLVGGGASVRMPIRNINLISFDPPRLSAGCGGIDLFGGAFSFINADQLVALFRQIAANAVGVAFKAAIDAINPALGKLMQDFQNKIAALNSMMKNTCALATTIMDKTGVSGAIRSFVDENVSSETGSKSGMLTDMFSGIDSFLSNANTVTRNVQKSGKEPELGNLTWMALNTTQAGQMLGNPQTGETDANGANEIVMSLIGTVVNGPENSSDTTASDGSVAVDNGRYWAPTIRLLDLKDGNMSGNKPMYALRCADGYDLNKCMKISKQNLSFGGVSGYVNLMLFGDAAGRSISTDSIVGKLVSCSGNACDFTSAQKTFIGNISAPVLGLMKKVQSMPGAAAQMAVLTAPIVTDELTLKYAESALVAAQAAFSGTTYTKDEKISSAERDLLNEVIQLRTSSSADFEKLNAAIAYSKAISENNPAVFVKPPIK
ncbi:MULTISPECIES: conjugal transfer protein TraH [Caballeronia]|uniref:conjugal transfer protein TraH n=1 Tax=Caballeronia TaxID=1827195 RepID=UPI001FCF9FE1|nr:MULTISPECIES: conjugal transfer protein TraH [Caballeronia]MDR5799263.1 conjugal transfer protein TraH [Caballeronia sp. LZ001]